MSNEYVVGLNIRQEPTSRSPILGLLPRNASIEVGELSSNGKWGRIAKVLEGDIVPARAGGTVPSGAATGWVFLGELDAEPEAYDRVVTLGKPHPVKQGDVIGYLGEDVPACVAPIACQPVSRKLLHLEVFSGDDVPAYLAASRQWAASLPDSQRTLLV